MQDNPRGLVTIVIVNYNYDRFLRLSIESALQQTYKEIEVLVVDDGSTDGSRATIHTFNDKITAILRENGGHVSAFNAGFARARGDIVMFLDADDLLYPTCVQTVMANWSPNVSKVQFRLDTIDENGADQHMPFPYFAADLTPEKLKQQALHYGVYPWTVSSGNAYARSLLEKILPIDSRQFSRAPDGVVNKLAPLYGDVVSINQMLGAYRVHGKNKWAQGKGRLNGRVIAETVQMDLSLHQEFVRRAKGLALDLAPRDDLMVSQHLEYRMLALRLDPCSYPIKADTRLKLAIKGAQSALDAPNFSNLGRAFWVVWFFVLAALPRSAVDPVYAATRSQTGRKGAAKFLIGLARGKARLRAAT